MVELQGSPTIQSLITPVPLPETTHRHFYKGSDSDAKGGLWFIPETVTEDAQRDA